MRLALKVVEGLAIRRYLQLAAGSLGTFTVDSQVGLPGQLESDLRVDGRQVVGTITNRLDTPLYDAALIIDYQVLRVGDLKRGEVPRGAPDDPARQRLGRIRTADHLQPAVPQLEHHRSPLGHSARRDILDSAFGSGFNFTRLCMGGPTLLGWIDAPAAVVDVQDTRPVTFLTRPS